MKKNMKSRIFATAAIFLLLSIGIYITIRLTHGIVLFDVYFYKNLKVNTDLNDKVRIIGKITPRLTEGKTAGDMQARYKQPGIEERLGYSLFSRAKCLGSDVRFSIVSEDKIAAAYIREVVTIDARGKTKEICYQNRELVDERDKRYTSSFSEPYFSWHGVYTEGNGIIEITGYVIMDGSNERIQFQKSIPIECLEIKKIMTRKEWDKFFETLPRSYWN